MASCLRLASLVSIAVASDFPAGKITVTIEADSDVACTARDGMTYPLNQFRNGVFGPYSDKAIYGYDVLSEFHGKYYLDEFTPGTYTVEGDEPALYACAFSPSEGSFPVFKEWHMCGCCFEFSTVNATDFAGLCNDSEDVCEQLCEVEASGPQDDRKYSVKVHGQKKHFFDSMVAESRNVGESKREAPHLNVSLGSCNCFNTCLCKDWDCCCHCNDCASDPDVAPHCTSALSV